MDTESYGVHAFFLFYALPKLLSHIHFNNIPDDKIVDNISYTYI